MNFFRARQKGKLSDTFSSDIRSSSGRSGLTFASFRISYFQKFVLKIKCRHADTVVFDEKTIFVSVYINPYVFCVRIPGIGNRFSQNRRKTPIQISSKMIQNAQRYFKCKSIFRHILLSVF